MLPPFASNVTSNLVSNFSPLITNAQLSPSPFSTVFTSALNVTTGLTPRVCAPQFLYLPFSSING